MTVYGYNLGLWLRFAGSPASMWNLGGSNVIDMQTTIQIVCGKGKSLRESIERDAKLANEDFRVVTRRRVGRNPGWTTIESTYPGRQGTIRMEWIDTTNMLICRVVNRRPGSPSLIVGDFVDYLLKRHRKRLKFITIFVDKS